LKEFELQTNSKATVYKAYLNLRAKIINSLTAEDISALSQYPYGVGNRSAFDLYTHVVTQYIQSTHSRRLQPQSSISYARPKPLCRHMQLWLTLIVISTRFYSPQGTQPLSELDKCNHLIDALNKDAAGIYAAQLYVQAYPLIHHRTFNGLVAHFILHARNSVITTGSISTPRPLLLFQPSLPPHLFLFLA
jgi:hypothetical protein